MRTRFAPSPTGHLHVGGARVAILNWLLARHHGGAFVLRIEDTDRERNVPGAEAALLDDLRWLGLDWDEGPGVGGPYGPYRQSDREALYREHAQRLLAEGKAYPCDCPPLAESAGQGRARCACADRGPAAPVPAGSSIRFRVPDVREVGFEDLVRGPIVHPAASIEDFVLLRSDGRATYNLAATVDDAAMRITHVVRGADHIANSPKQLLLHRAFGWEPPRLAHIPLILGPDRQKLSKRHGATSVAEHRRIGYLPEALFNYLCLLSWSSPSGEEFLPRERLVVEVDLGRVGASDAVFDPEKLRWLSGRYIQELPPAEFAARAAPFLDPAARPIDAERLTTALALVRNRVSVLSEVAEQLARFAGPATDEQRARRAAALADPAARAVVEALRERLPAPERWAEPDIQQAVRAAGEAAGARGKALFGPVRAALTGEEHGPELAKVIHVLGPARAAELLRTDGEKV
jgi:glutamyl-tRNA synthetase